MAFSEDVRHQDTTHLCLLEPPSNYQKACLDRVLGLSMCTPSQFSDKVLQHVYHEPISPESLPSGGLLFRLRPPLQAYLFLFGDGGISRHSLM